MKPVAAFIDMAARAAAVLLAVPLNYRVRFFTGNFKDRVFSYANARSFRSFGKGAVISRSCVLVNPHYVSLGEGATIGAHTVITAWDDCAGERFTPEISIGAFTSIGAECHVTAIDRIVIGDGVLIGKKITITDNSHGDTDGAQLQIPPAHRRMTSKGPVIIEDNVWVGDKATVLAGTRIGRGAIIAANAVVTGDVPEGCIAAGAPARIIKNMLSGRQSAAGVAAAAPSRDAPHAAGSGE